MESILKWTINEQERETPRDNLSNKYISNSIFLPPEVAEELIFNLEGQSDPHEALEIVIKYAMKLDDEKEI